MTITDTVGRALRRDVFRVFSGPRWPTIIDSAGLPGDVGGRIAEIVRRARLWTAESDEVARELVAHAAEAVDRGVAPGEVASSLGEPAVVSRLIRRAVRRKRHWLWHARVWTVRATAGVAGLAVLAAGVLAARYVVGDPSPTRNFIAEMNAPLADYGPEERSWPLIKQAHAGVQEGIAEVTHKLMERAEARSNQSLTDEQRALKFDQSGLFLLPALDPSHPDYAEVVAALARVGDALSMAREAASRPVVGRLFSTRQEEPGEGFVYPPGWLPEAIPDAEDPAEQDMVVGVLLPWLGPVRSLSQWLAFEARVAERAGDGARVVENLDAMFGLASQTNRDEFLISNMVSMSIVEMARHTLSEIIRERPEALSREQLVHIAHRLGEARGMFLSLPLTWEVNMFEDFLQRSYTDDGRGGGHLTNEGVANLVTYAGLSGGDGDLDETFQLARLVVSGDRASQRALYHHAISLLREDERAGYEIFRGRGLSSERWIEDTLDRTEFSPVSILMPALGRAVSRQATARAGLDGTLTAIAAELWRRDTGDWPASVADLVPRYLPRVPEDPFDGAPMRLSVRDGGLVVYCLGRDLDDDGGDRRGAKAGILSPEPWTVGTYVPSVDGDWVLFPNSP